MSMRAGTVMAEDAATAKLAVHFSDSDIAHHLDYASLVDHIANSYRDPVAAPVRVGVEAKGLELLVMSAVSPRYAGTKILTIRADRTEERRVGKECVSTCNTRWSTYP